MVVFNVSIAMRVRFKMGRRWGAPEVRTITRVRWGRVRVE